MALPKLNIQGTSRSFCSKALDPVEAFASIYNLGTPGLLAEGRDDENRYFKHSILGFRPLMTIRIRKGRLLFNNKTYGQEIKTATPLRTLKIFLEQLKTQLPELRQLPIGAFGYVGYDCIQYIEPVTIKHENDFDESCFTIFSQYLVIDHQENLCTAVLLNENEAPSETKMDSFLDLLKTPAQKTQSTQESSSDQLMEFDNIYKSEFESSVKKIKDHIKEGNIFQAVFSQKTEFKIKGSPLNIYKELKTGNPSTYHFYLDTGDLVVLGASPEMLVRATNGVVETCPIAGTRKRGADVDEDKKLRKALMASPKEKAEHMMLVDLSRNDLGRICKPGTVDVSRFMEIREFSHVMHLVSVVQGQLKEEHSCFDALFSCFPAGTLSGAPKIRAMQILSDLEQTSRGFYGGAFAMAHFGGDFDSCIAIRCLTYKDGIATIQAGAGIVADSRADREYQEILDKTAALRAAVSRAGAV